MAKLRAIGLAAAVIGTAIMMAGAVLMIYPELMGSVPGDRVLKHLYLSEGIKVTIIGGVVVACGVIAYNISPRMRVGGLQEQGDANR